MSRIATIAMMTILLWGCAGKVVREESPVPLGESHAQAELENVLQYWDHPEENARAISSYQGLLEGYRSRDGKFEVAVLTAIALHQLRDGRMHEFERTVGRLKGYTGRMGVLPDETDYVLAVHAALHGEPMPEEGNPRIRGAVAELIGDLQNN